VYLYDTKKGWMIFDYYGAFKQNIPQSNLKNVQVIKNDLYGFDSVQNIHRYNTQTFKETVYRLNTKIDSAIKFQLNVNDLFALESDGLYIFSIVR
jgi:hypothetical protein